MRLIQPLGKVGVVSATIVDEGRCRDASDILGDQKTLTQLPGRAFRSERKKPSVCCKKGWWFIHFNYPRLILGRGWNTNPFVT